MFLNGLTFNDSGVKEGYVTLINLIKDAKKKEALKNHFNAISQGDSIHSKDILEWIERYVDTNDQSFFFYQTNLSMRLD